MIKRLGVMRPPQPQIVETVPPIGVPLAGALESEQRRFSSPGAIAPTQGFNAAGANPYATVSRQENILAMNLREQILDLERLIKALTLTSGATPDEIATLQEGLEIMRAKEAQQEASKQAWLSVIAERCETGDDVACEGLSVEEQAYRQWVNSQQYGNNLDPALPEPGPYLDTFAMRGKGPSPQQEAKAVWMSRVGSAGVPPPGASGLNAGSNGRTPLPGRRTAPGSPADSAARAAEVLAAEDPDVNPFLASRLRHRLLHQHRLGGSSIGSVRCLAVLRRLGHRSQHYLRRRGRRLGG